MNTNYILYEPFKNYVCYNIYIMIIVRKYSIIILYVYMRALKYFLRVGGTIIPTLCDRMILYYRYALLVNVARGKKKKWKIIFPRRRRILNNNM